MKIEKEYDNIFRYVLYRTGNRYDAEDITQETFLKYIEHTEYHGRGNERQLLYTIARNLCIDRRRKETTEILPDDAQDRNDDIIRKIAVRQAMEHLLPEEREIIIMRLVNGENISVIAKIFNTSRFTMSRRIKAITEKLKKELGKEELI
ncbi:MAG: RNA polymerase sigma factor [Ruminococcus sp.]|nr:RNA polymerase sigma factor [Ruminococcus sp.]MDE6783861.1 RNA polymerase sigma factor [Ruminococcus sp.]